MRAGNLDLAGARSVLDWWALAGVDVLVEDAPRDWLAPPRASVAAAPVTAPPETETLPATLAALHDHLAAAPLFGAGTRLMPEGSAASGLMLLIDQPESDDAAAGSLLSGEVGLLFDRMLGAIGRDRASIYLACLAPARIQPDAAEQAGIAALARHHAVLAAPRVLLLIGDAPSRALLGMGAAEARGRPHEINHGGATLRAIATLHPRALLERPQHKGHAWRDLQLLMGELNR